MLDELIFGRETSRSILIIDRFTQNGALVLLSLINEFSAKSQNILHLFGYDFITLESYEQFFKNKSNVNIHDCIIEIPLDCLEKIQAKNDEGKTIMFIDNANLIVADYGNPFELTKLVVEARKNKNLNTLIVLIHEDAISEYHLNQLKYVFQTVIRIENLISKNNYEYNLNVTHKSSIGKLSRTTEELIVSEKLAIKKIAIVKKAAEEKYRENEDESSSLKNLTFNLNLNEDDLEAKRNLVLPYEIINKPMKQDIKVKPTENQSGLILYQPDERDDVDEEDPDDDLNF